MAERKVDGGEIFIEVLNRHGVEYIIGSPGSDGPGAAQCPGDEVGHA